jgi:hypothetical protein
MSSDSVQAARADNFYHPPDWDPRKESLDKVRARMGLLICVTATPALPCIASHEAVQRAFECTRRIYAVQILSNAALCI